MDAFGLCGLASLVFLTAAVISAGCNHMVKAWVFTVLLAVSLTLAATVFVQTITATDTRIFLQIVAAIPWTVAIITACVRDWRRRHPKPDPVFTSIWGEPDGDDVSNVVLCEDGVPFGVVQTQPISTVIKRVRERRQSQIQP